MGFFINTGKKNDVLLELERTTADGANENLDEEDEEEEETYGGPDTEGEETPEEEPAPEEPPTPDTPPDDYEAEVPDDDTPVPAEEPPTPDTPPEPEPATDDAPVPDEGGDDAPTPDEGDTDEEPTDYGTPDTEGDEGDAPTPDEGGDDAPTPDEGEEGDDEPTDYGSPEDTEGGEEGDAPSPDEDGEEGEPSDDGYEQDGDELGEIEKVLFSDLSDQQINIRVIELKKSYLELYKTIESIIDKVNKINKTDDNIVVIEFIVNKLSELRNIVDDYLTKTFATKTYVENSAEYQRYLAVLYSIDKLLKELAPKVGIKVKEKKLDVNANSSEKL